MRRSIRLACLFAVVVLFGLQSREAFAQVQARAPWKWATYPGADGKTYDNPKWNDKGNNKRTLSTAQGYLTFPQNPAVTKVVMKVYPQGAVPGTYGPTPVITYVVTPAPQYFGAPINAWLVTGVDSPLPPAQQAVFTEGDQIKFTWEVTTTDNGVDTVSTFDVIVVVTFH